MPNGGYDSNPYPSDEPYYDDRTNDDYYGGNGSGDVLGEVLGGVLGGGGVRNGGLRDVIIGAVLGKVLTR